MENRTEEISRLLGEGDRNGLNALLYRELRLIADRRMASERRGHTLQATALVHETYLRMLSQEEVGWNNRQHFYAAAASAMSRILIDHARQLNSEKRGGHCGRVTLGLNDIAVELDSHQAAGLHEALALLEKEDERAAAVTRLRFLIGLSVGETAEALGISERSIHREWAFARARLFKILGE